MVVHMVSFKYKTDTSATARADHRARLSTLRDIDGILDFKVGEDFVRSPRSFDSAENASCSARMAACTRGQVTSNPKVATTVKSSDQAA